VSEFEGILDRGRGGSVQVRIFKWRPALLAEWNTLKRMARSTAQAGGGETPEAVSTTAAPVVPV